MIDLHDRQGVQKYPEICVNVRANFGSNCISRLCPTGENLVKRSKSFSGKRAIWRFKDNADVKFLKIYLKYLVVLRCVCPQVHATPEISTMALSGSPGCFPNAVCHIPCGSGPSPGFARKCTLLSDAHWAP